MEVEFALPTDHAYDIVSEALWQQARRFGMRPSELLTAILTGRIMPIRRKGCPVSFRDCGQSTTVVFEAPDNAASTAARWSETHPEASFGEFVLNLALGLYDLVEAPKSRNNHRKNGHATPRCRVCGRPLTSPEAIAKGIGPVCEARLQTQAA